MAAAERYAIIVSAAGVGVLLVLLVADSFSVESRNGPELWFLAVSVWLTEFFPVRVPTQHDIKDVTTSTTFVFALLLGWGPAAAAVALAIGSLAADLLRRKPVYRATFNVGQYVLSIAAAGAVHAAIGHGANGLLGAVNLLATGLTFFLVNHLLVGVAVALAQRLPLNEVLIGDVRFQFVTTAILLGMAPLVRVVATHEMLLLPTLLLPLAAVHLASKGVAQESRFRSLVQNASDVILVLQPDTTIRYQTPSAVRVLGYEADELDGARLTSLVHPDDVARARAFFSQAVRGGVSPVTEWRLRHANGAWRHVEVTGNNLLADPTVNGIVVTMRDVNDRKALEDELKHQAFHDSLTKLANRALLHDRVAHALTGRFLEQPFALLLLDLDDFKAINDSLGHAAGDELLIAVAGRLLRCLRPADTAARLGGDEFAILLERVGSEGEASAVAARVIEELRAPFVLEGTEVFVHASLGLALGSVGGQDAEGLLRDADVAMYAAKAAGKGGYAFFDPSLHAGALDRLERKANLQRAVEQGQFLLNYQPIVDLRTGGITGVEALVRWQHPERGLVPPADFIPLAEETGLIVELGRWVLREACRQARRWQEARPGRPALRMSINLSAQQFQRPELVPELEELIRLSGIDASTLVLEITETLLMQNTDVTDAKLRELKGLGLQLAIDDFGTGYSSLSYLKRFPIDILKVDKAFVDGVDGAAEDAAFVRAILRLAQTLQLQTVAEGVERMEQSKALRALGCHFGQGYLFAKPLMPAGIDELLARQDLANRSLTVKSAALATTARRRQA